MPQARTSGFTLIELLVVITIIVVLLALLTPALDKAIYQAELTQCSGVLKTLGSSVTLYAMDNKRRYPLHAEADSAGGRQRRPTSIKVHMEFDERPILKSFLQINKQLNCPLTETMDYEDNVDAESSINIPYGLWYGWYYDDPTTGGRHKAMSRMGDRFRWTDPDGTFDFSVIAADRESSHIQSAHPDKAGKLVNRVRRNENATQDVEGIEYFNPLSKFTSANWEGSRTRGLMDRNFNYADLSVIRLVDLEDRTDERVVPVPERRNLNTWPIYRHYLPRR